ncbi:MAG: Fic family protein [Acidiferrobacter sp.]
MKPDMTSALDRGEAVSLMEPLLIGSGASARTSLMDLALELAQESAGFRRSLSGNQLSALASLVRSMNCYYSNLIEGHDTHPIDIERALKNDYSLDARKRDWQLEAKAHIAVQRWIDTGGLKGRAITANAISEIHRRFYEELPDDLLWIEDPATPQERVRVAPGALRTRDVAVGRHVAISPAAVPRFLKRLEEVYGSLGPAETLLAIAAAHHRLVSIHPFLDGNGRVARLVSHAVLWEVLDTGGVWSVARGLARNVDTYKSHLMACDLRRRNDLDGRGHLSEGSLVEFTRFFLTTCIDQVRFMGNLMQPEKLRARVLLWAEEEIRVGHLPPQSRRILEAILYRGELPRASMAEVVDTGERQARRIVATLLEQGVLASESPHAPLRLAFPATLAARWLPGLFPDRAG